MVGLAQGGEDGQVDVAVLPQVLVLGVVVQVEEVLDEHALVLIRP